MALATAALPNRRRASAALRASPAASASAAMASNRASTNVSIRLTKKLATPPTADSGGTSSPAARRPANSSSPAMYASITWRWRSSEKMSVTLMQAPRPTNVRMASTPSTVAGTLTNTLGLSTMYASRSTSATVAAAS